MLGSIEKLGAKDPKTLKLRKKLSDEFMELKLAPRMFEALIANLRGYNPKVAVEFARKSLSSQSRPSFQDLELHLKGAAA